MTIMSSSVGQLAWERKESCLALPTSAAWERIEPSRCPALVRRSRQDASVRFN